jgi:hypothetical protein
MKTLVFRAALISALTAGSALAASAGFLLRAATISDRGISADSPHLGVRPGRVHP